MGSHVAWGSLSPEERAEKQRQHRVRAKLRKMGKPSLVDAAPVVQRVRRLHDECGMSHQAIANAAGPNPKTGKMFGQSSVSDLYRGYRRDPEKPIRKIPRTTYDRVMSIPYQAPGESSTALVPALGTRRRMQALCAIGFGTKFQCNYLGSKDYQYHWRLLTGKKADTHSRSKFLTVEVATRERIKEMYEKLRYTDPHDLGVMKGEVTKCKNIGIKHRYAPPSCWDDDTIDDPLAIPEWTGQCGTVYGFRIHYREGILPVCPECATARSLARQWPLLAAMMGVAAAPGTPGRAIPEEDAAAIVSALAAGDQSTHAIAFAFGVSTKTVVRMRRELTGDVPMGTG